MDRVGNFGWSADCDWRRDWLEPFLHAAHNALDQTVFGPITVADNKMFYVSETGIFTIICAWVIMIILYKKLNPKS